MDASPNWNADIPTEFFEENYDPEHWDGLKAGLVTYIELVTEKSGDGLTYVGGQPMLGNASPIGHTWPMRSVPDEIDAVVQRASGDNGQGATLRQLLSQPRPYSFIAQLDLEALQGLRTCAPHLAFDLLPRHGRLLFFCDILTVPWLTGSAACRVVWDPSCPTSLRTLQTPQELLEGTETKPNPAPLPTTHEGWEEVEKLIPDIDINEMIRVAESLQAAAEDNVEVTTFFPKSERRYALYSRIPDASVLDYSVPPKTKAVFKALAAEKGVVEQGLASDRMLTIEFNSMLMEYMGKNDVPTQVLGDAIPLQNEPRLDLADGHEQAQREARERAAAQLVLLLQLEFADVTGDPLDEGALYFYIDRDDAKAQRFDCCSVVYQAT